MEIVIGKIRNKLSKEEITIFPPATDLEIKEFEFKFNITLPDDLKRFYKFCNGFEGGEWLFRILPLDEIEIDKDEFVGEYLIIAEYLVYCVTWGIKLAPDNSCKIFHTKYKIEDGKMNSSQQWESLSEFIEDYLREGLDGVEK